MFKPVTRVLVLSGILTLLTSAGSIDGAEGDSLQASSGQQPVKVTVKANNDFSFDLYRQLTQENSDGNLFFSPYSISQVLAMTSEGARGQTAKEIGNVLRLPAACNRIGDDAQLMPWKTSLIHSGYSTLNKRLNSAQTNPDYDAVKSQIERLEKEYIALEKRLAAHHAIWGEWTGPQVKLGKKELDEVTRRRKEVHEKMTDLEASISPYEVRVANAIWGEETFPFNQTYVNTIEKHYKTGGMFSVDFRNNFAATRQRINDWCAKQTSNRIKEILPQLPQEQAQKLRIALTNAIYFRADWDTKFNVGRTKVRDFTLANGDKVKTSIMHGPKFSVRYAAFNADGSLFPTPALVTRSQSTGLYPDADGFAIAEVPYRGNEVSMLVIVPNHHSGLSAIEENLNAANLSRWIQQLKQRRADIYLPKFKYEAAYSLKQTLTNMGMKQAFNVSADFSGLSDSATEPVYLGMFQHKAFIEVNETSTEAAAGTASGALFGGPPKTPFIPEFRADHPFLYIIRDVVSGSVLFVGRMTRP